MTNALEARREHVQQKAAGELIGCKRHLAGALRIGSTIILILECHLAIVETKQTLVTDGDAVRVAPEIFHRLLGAAEGALGINNPLDAERGLEESGKRFRIA